MTVKKIALFGGGPACLIAALQLSKQFEVHIYEKGKTVGRKFLVAGNGGFNLTNGATGNELYTAFTNHPLIQNAIRDFDSVATRKWLANLGVETFIGSSGRVFPVKGIKPAEVLKKMIGQLKNQGVVFHFNHEFIGFNAEQLPLVQHKGNTFAVQVDRSIFGLGGGSWKKTGANSQWLNYFNQIGVKTSPFQSSNCGVNVNWAVDFTEKFAGAPLKNVAVKVNDKSRKGEVLITEYGLEGNALYPLISAVREKLSGQESCTIFIDLKPNNSLENLERKVSVGLKPKNYAYVFNLDKGALILVKNTLSKEDYLQPKMVARRLKSVPVLIQSLRPIDEAISTVGGIALSEVNANFSLRVNPNYYVVGEMLDWDAPTGGFLLQGCFSTGSCVGNYLLHNSSS